MKEVKTYLPDYRFTPKEAKWLIKTMKMLDIQRNELPMLNGAVFYISADKMQIRIFNLTTEVLLIFPEKISKDMPEKCWIPFDALEHYSKSKNSKWIFSTGSVNIDGVNFNIKDGEEYPGNIEFDEVEGICSLCQSDVQKHMQAHVAGDPEEDLITSGIHFGELNIASTDKIRILITDLAVSTIPVKPITVPVEFAKLYSEISNISFFHIKKHSGISFNTTNIQVSSKRIIGKYPSFKAVLDSSGKNTLFIFKGELERIKTLQPVYKHNSNNVVEFGFSPDGNTVYSESFSPEINAKIKLNSIYKGSFDSVCVNAVFLQDVLKIADGNISALIGTPLHPIVFFDESHEWYYVLMPCRKNPANE